MSLKTLNRRQKDSPTECHQPEEYEPGSTERRFFAQFMLAAPSTHDLLHGPLTTKSEFDMVIVWLLFLLLFAVAVH